jgi:hypothetical protein
LLPGDFKALPVIAQGIAGLWTRRGRARVEQAETQEIRASQAFDRRGAAIFMSYMKFLSSIHLTKAGILQQTCNQRVHAKHAGGMLSPPSLSLAEYVPVVVSDRSFWAEGMRCD